MVVCTGSNCRECLFEGDCTLNAIKWLMAEYKKKIWLTQREKYFVEFAKIGWIARDGHQRLWWFQEKPWKYACVWKCDPLRQSGSIFDIELFPFIKWEDEEPWSVEELRKLEVGDE